MCAHSRIKVLGAAIAACGLGYTGAGAATIHVCPGGPYPTIQAGIDVAITDDVVEVCDAGSPYTGAGNTNLVIVGKAITVRSEGGATLCTIDCAGGQGDVRAFHISGALACGSLIEGFTIKNGHVSGDPNGGGAIWIESLLTPATGPTIQNCVFSYNKASTTSRGGGAIYCEGLPSPLITQNSFDHNTAEVSGNGGGAILCYYDGEDAPPTPTIGGGNVFDHNTATRPPGYSDVGFAYGGALLCVKTAPTIRHNTFTWNAATWDKDAQGPSTGSGARGGAIAGLTLATPWTIEENRVQNNSAWGSTMPTPARGGSGGRFVPQNLQAEGGGIYVTCAGAGALQNHSGDNWTITDNIAFIHFDGLPSGTGTAPFTCRGGGVYAEDMGEGHRVLFTGNKLERNKAYVDFQAFPGQDYAIAATAQGGGFYGIIGGPFGQGSSECSGNRVEQNSAAIYWNVPGTHWVGISYADGGGMYLENGFGVVGPLLVSANHFEGNGATSSIPLLYYLDDVAVTGGGVTLGGRIVFSKNRVVGNSVSVGAGLASATAVGGGVAASHFMDAQVTLFDNFIVGNSASALFSGEMAAGSAYGGGVGSYFSPNQIEIANDTIADNRVSGENNPPRAHGAGVAVQSDGWFHLGLLNTIVWGNQVILGNGSPQTLEQVYVCGDPDGWPADVGYSDIEGGENPGIKIECGAEVSYPDGSFGATNNADDPSFVAPGYWDTSGFHDGDYHIDVDSPCKEKAINEDLFDLDYDGNSGELVRLPFTDDFDGDIRSCDVGQLWDQGADEIAPWAGCRNCPGDMNCDGLLNFNDIDPFVLALSDRAAYEAQYPDCCWLNGDLNGDCTVDFGDLDPFVALLSSGATCP